MGTVSCSGREGGKMSRTGVRGSSGQSSCVWGAWRVFQGL